MDDPTHSLQHRARHATLYMCVCVYVYEHTYTLIHMQIAGVNYGGHVTDDFDRRVLYTYIGEMFKDDVLEQPYHKYVHVILD